MSYTEMMAVWPNERAESLGVLRNSHGYAPYVWNEIGKRYMGLADHSYFSRVEELWPQYKREDMAHHHRTVLLMTYDRALIHKEDYSRAAADLRAFLADFPPAENRVCHLEAIAELFASAPDCPVIGIDATSLSDNFFADQWDGEQEKYVPADTSQFWNVYEHAAQFRKAG